MITDGIIHALSSFFGWLLGLLPAPDQATVDAFAGFPDQVRGIVQWIAALAPVVPFDGIEWGLHLVVMALGIYMPVVVIRKAISMFTGGGGM